MPDSQIPHGVILAGGRGVRLGGGKAAVLLAGRPLLTYPLRAMRGALEQVAVIAKPGTLLPSLSGVPVWLEPETPVHPLVGIATALERAGGRPVLSCPADVPLISSSLIRGLADAYAAASASAGERGAVAAVLTLDGRPEPLLGCFSATCAPALWRAARAGAPATDAVTALASVLVDVPAPDAAQLFNVNTPDDLLQAAAMLTPAGPGGPTDPGGPTRR